MIEYVENPYGADILASYLPDYDRPVFNRKGELLGYGAIVYPVGGETSLPVAFDDDWGRTVVVVSCANVVVPDPGPDAVLSADADYAAWLESRRAEARSYQMENE